MWGGGEYLFWNKWILGLFPVNMPVAAAPSQAYFEEEYILPSDLLSKLDHLSCSIEKMNANPYMGEKYKFCQWSLIYFSVWTHDFFLLLCPVSPLSVLWYHEPQAMAQKGHQKPSFFDSKRICNDLTLCPSSPITHCHWCFKKFQKVKPCE